MKLFFALACAVFFFLQGSAQTMASAAAHFIATLSVAQKEKTVYPFESDERYSFHFFPITDRKGIPLKELTPAQRTAAMALVKTCLSQS
ncbi:MAG TPA: DUF3500 domain-containing protein, partial [Chitinophagaceae bacterium]|nr:DUF3500 domain-containing protein [Chitinophagaceae bacterium]